MSIMLDDEPRIKNGVYPVIYHSHYFTNKFNRYVLVLRFQLAELNEEHKNSLFSMWLNLKYFSKNKKGKISFMVSKNSKLAKTWVNLFPSQKIKRDDKQKLKPECLRISKIVRLKLPDSLP